ncbi:MAG: DNA repair and recombination protein RadA [Candidatus Heimdallarchaeaceae archaeon]
MPEMKDTPTTRKSPKKKHKEPSKEKDSSNDWIEEIAQTKLVKEKREHLSDVPIHSIPGIGPAIGEKLMSAGYLTLASVAHASPLELIEHCEIGEHTAKRIITAARNQVGIGFETASEILRKRSEIIRIKTGSKTLDTLLEGGIETKSITEFSGEFRTGKSQLCFQLCVNTAIEKKYGGMEAGVIFIDTEGTFRPERITDMCSRYGEDVDTEAVLSRIHVGRAYNSDHQMLLVLESPKIITANNVKLLVIDSLTSHFRAEFTGRGTILERQQKLNKFLHQLLRLADVYDLAVVVTNQVQTKIDTLYGESTLPIGGNIVAHSCTTRIFLRKAKGDKRIARVIDSPSIPETEAAFRITKKGIIDTEDFE